MKPQKTIIYDDNCPLCCWYTDAFVQTGLLQQDGRQSFTATQLTSLPQFDLDRSKDEIPLVDRFKRKYFKVFLLLALN